MQKHQSFFFRENSPHDFDGRLVVIFDSEYRHDNDDYHHNLSRFMELIDKDEKVIFKERIYRGFL